MAVATSLRSVLPSATSVVVLRATNDDGASVLCVRRVLDAAGAVLFDMTVGTEREIEDVTDEVNVEYLDVLLVLVLLPSPQLANRRMPVHSATDRRSRL